jgi:hypothetical protein
VLTERGDGTLYKIAAELQRKYFDPPEMRETTGPFAAQIRAESLTTPVRRCVASRFGLSIRADSPSRCRRLALSKFPILAFNQVGEPAIFDFFSRAHVWDSCLPFVLFGHDNHAWVRRRCEGDHERVCTRPSFDRIDESRMARHNANEMSLDVVIYFNEQFFLPLFAPSEKFIFFLLKLVEYLDGCSQSTLFG